MYSCMYVLSVVCAHPPLDMERERALHFYKKKKTKSGVPSLSPYEEAEFVSDVASLHSDITTLLH